MKFVDEVAIVTGAARGIGHAIATRLAKEGARVIIADLNGDAAAETAASLCDAGHVADSIRVDVTDPQQGREMVDEVRKRFERIDILINNAGVGLNRPFLETTPEDWERTIRVNLNGTFFCSQAAARAMASNGGGRIVNIASISGVRGAQNRSAYGASKAGVILLTKVMALELAARNVRVNAVAPGPVMTDMTNVTHTPEIRRTYHSRIPMRRYAEADEIAAAVVFLASADSSFIKWAHSARRWWVRFVRADVRLAGNLVIKKRYTVLLSFASLAILTYIDRLAIAVAGPRMQRELGFTPERWGWIVGIFAVSYGGLEIPAGALGDRYGQRAVITRIVIWWSLFTALTGSVSSFGMLLAVRFLFGAGEAGAFPNMSGALSRWFPASERAFAQGSIWGASRLGGIISPLLVVPLMASLGWRAAFWIFGSVGIVWALVWRSWYRESPAEIGDAAPRSGHTAIPWSKLFRSRALWLIMLMYSCYGWGSYFYLSWLHTYLVKGRGLTEQEMGIFSTLPFVLGACANLIGGILGDRLVRRFGIRNGRRFIGAFSLAMGALCVLGTALTQGKIIGVVLISVGYGFMDLMLPSAWAMCLDIGGRYAGAVSGAMNSSGHIGGFTCSVLFGYVVQRYGYNAPLFAIATMLFASACVFSQIDASKPIEVEDAAAAKAATRAPEMA